MNSEKDIAYLLHKKQFRENSLLIELLTLKNGKISCLIKYSNNPKKNKNAILQPCQLLEVDYILKPNLSSLVAVEIHHNTKSHFAINSDNFMFYQYINELLIHVLYPQLECERIFYNYQKSLLLLSENYTNSALRLIECSLINQYSGLPRLDTDIDGCDISSEKIYYFYPEIGVTTVAKSIINTTNTKISGKTILAFLAIQQDIIDEDMAKQAKGLTTYLINNLLAGKVLKTRRIYQELSNYLGNKNI